LALEQMTMSKRKQHAAAAAPHPDSAPRPARVPPAQAAAASAPEPPAPSPRRRILLRLWVGLGLASAVELGFVLASFLRPRRTQAADAGVVIAGPLERFEPGSVTAFPTGRFYLVRLTDGGFLALDRQCTHLGCTVPWVPEAKRFQCPCHASAFDIRGAVLGPPAPRPLDLHPVRIENGIVKVDTQQRLRRDAFDPEQVTTP
jgi:cytochrome b6-f complex iron-sulfur subunit